MLALHCNWPKECIDALFKHGAIFDIDGIIDSTIITNETLEDLLTRNCIIYTQDGDNTHLKWDLSILQQPQEPRSRVCSGHHYVGSRTYKCCTCDVGIVCRDCRQSCHGEHEVVVEEVNTKNTNIVDYKLICGCNGKECNKTNMSKLRMNDYKLSQQPRQTMIVKVTSKGSEDL